jgi:hypothetical protein
MVTLWVCFSSVLIGLLEGERQPWTGQGIGSQLHGKVARPDDWTQCTFKQLTVLTVLFKLIYTTVYPEVSTLIQFDGKMGLSCETISGGLSDVKRVFLAINNDLLGI